MGAVFLALTTTFVSAVSAGAAAGGSLFANLALAAVLSIASYILCKTRPLLALLAVAGAAALGLWLGVRAATPDLSEGHVANLIGDAPVYIEASVASARRYPHKLKLELECLRAGFGENVRKAHGRLLLTIARPRKVLGCGDVIAFRARLRRPANFGNPGEFDYVGFLARRGIFVTSFLWDDSAIEVLARPVPGLGSLLPEWRRRVRRSIGSVADKTTGAVLAAMVLGERGGIPDGVRKEFARAGVAHLLAISGLHIGLVYGGGYLFARWLLGGSARLLLALNLPALAACLALVPALVYAALAGWGVPTQRALVMVMAFAAATVLGRPFSLIRSLAVAATLLVAVHPLAVREVSFQLSFAAVLGIAALVSQRRRGGAAGKASARTPSPGLPWRAVGWVRTSLCISVAAAASTAPIVALHFQRVSLVGPVANLIVIPVLGPGAVVPAVLGAFLLPLSEVAARALFGLAALSVEFGLAVVSSLARIPGASWTSFVPTDTELFLYYLLLAVTMAARRFDRKLVSLLLVIVGWAIVTDVTFWTWRRHFDQRLHVSFLSVGQGESTVVEFPGGEVMAIDGGPYYQSGFDSGKRLVTPFLRRRKIMSLDYMVITHGQTDHCGGVPSLVRAFRPREVWWNGGYEKRCLGAVIRALEGYGGTLHPVAAGARRVIGGVELTVCHPPGGHSAAGANNLSVVVRLRHGEVSFALTGDIEAPAERSIVQSGCLDRTVVLKVPHHGSLSSSTPAFLQAVSPRIAVFSVGRQNRFGFPKREVLARYRRLGIKVFRTDLDGAVEVTSDSLRYSVFTCRKGGRCS